MNEAKAILKEYGQEQLLRFYDELNDTEKKELLDQIKSTDFSVIEKSIKAMAEAKRGEVSPIPAMTIEDIKAHEDEYRQAGLEEIKAGKVGAILLAGGMGTRLGSDDPKGMYNVGLTRDLFIFECLVNNLMDVVREADAYIHLFVMTSDKNDEKTRNFFEEKNYFGYKKEYVHFFKQEMAAATDYNGKAYLETKSRIATSPNGNGGWYISMKRSGLADFAEEQGVKWLNIFAVDNVLQRICDPVFVGAMVKQDMVCGAKVIRKVSRDEKVGVMCNEDGRPSIIEYYEMTDDMLDLKDEAGNPVYNFGVILNYIFEKKQLDDILSKNLPLHMVEKKIPYVDEAGNLISPDAPNGHKYETLVLDMIKLMDNCLVYEVEREREFAPIKNKTGVDSVESARELLKKNGVTL